jgi:predicted enzyme related to lactoylglutathione lyase
MRKPTRTNRIDYIEFPAKSAKALEAAKAFYTKVFGWTYQAWGDRYADTKSSGVSSGMNAHSERSPAPLPVIYSSDLERTRAAVLKAGGRIIKPIFPFPGGRRFHYRDPAGNELAVWSDRPAGD